MSKKGSKLSRCIRATIRIISKARDFYIQSMTECAGRVGYDNVMGCPAGQVSTTLPRSFSVNSSRSRSDEDLRDLIRTASKRSLENKLEADFLRQQQQHKSPPTTGPKGVPRSFSVGIGRIEEDKPCDFGGHEDVKVKTDLLYPRSRSYAATRRTSGVLA